MTIVTVSDKGQVVIPAQIRRDLGITPGCQLDFTVKGGVLCVEVRRQVHPATLDEGFGMLVGREPGPRKLGEFDVATTMRKSRRDRG